MGKEACTKSQNVRISPTCVPSGCGLQDLENWKIRTSKFYCDGKFEIIRKYAPTIISFYTVVASNWLKAIMYVTVTVALILHIYCTFTCTTTLTNMQTNMHMHIYMQVLLGWWIPTGRYPHVIHHATLLCSDTHGTKERMTTGTANPSIPNQEATSCA